MSSHIGVNLRVTQWGNQGGRAYMEDRYAVHFEKDSAGQILFAYFGIFDGHGGAEAAKFARDNLLAEITKYDEFWTDDDHEISECIKAGFLDTHQAMWKELAKWPRTQSGFPSTAGTTASIVIVKNLKMYVGHVGDSAVVLGHTGVNHLSEATFTAMQLTRDHKPESPEERSRIERSGGSVQAKSGIQRVVWNRPKRDHQGPVRRSTPIDRIPFLAVARSLGDLWSYNYTHKEFAVSPEPDVTIHRIDPNNSRLIILASDGLWNMMAPVEACRIVNESEMELERKIVETNLPSTYTENTAMKLVFHALEKWGERHVKADNVTAVVVHISSFSYHRAHHLLMKRRQYLAETKRELLKSTLDSVLICDTNNGRINPTIEHPGLLTPPHSQKIRPNKPCKSLSDTQLLKAILDEDSNHGSVESNAKILPLVADADIPTDVKEVFMLPAPDACKEAFDHSLLCKAKKRLNGVISSPPSGNTSLNESALSDDMLYPKIEGKSVVVIERGLTAWGDINLTKDRVATCGLITNNRKQIVRDYLLKRPGVHHGAKSKIRHTSHGYEFVTPYSLTDPQTSIPEQHGKLVSLNCVDKVHMMNNCITEQLTTMNPFYRLKQKHMNNEAMMADSESSSDVTHTAKVIKRSVSAPTAHELKRVHKCLTALKSTDVKSIFAQSNGSMFNDSTNTNHASCSKTNDPHSNPPPPQTATTHKPHTSQSHNGIVLRNRNKLSPVKTKPSCKPPISASNHRNTDKEQFVSSTTCDPVRHNLRHTPRRHSVDPTNCVPTSRMVRRLRSALKRKSTKSPIRGPPTVKRLRRSYDIHSR